jgi:hypothetical protein
MLIGAVRRSPLGYCAYDSRQLGRLAELGRRGSGSTPVQAKCSTARHLHGLDGLIIFPGAMQILIIFKVRFLV